MKKVMIGAIAVLFSLVGFGYAAVTQPPQNQLITNMGGEITGFNLEITYEQMVQPTTTLYEGQEFVTVRSPIGTLTPAAERDVLGVHRYNPVFYMWVDGNGNLSQVNITWLDPTNTSNRIWTINCRGGNQTPGTTGLGATGYVLGLTSGTEDGTISNMPRTLNNDTTVYRTDTVRGVLACSICPDGFPTTCTSCISPTSPPSILSNSTYSNTYTCNDGESYINGYLTFGGTFYYDLLTETIISASITGTVAAGSFNYNGASWAAKSCNTYSTDFECKAIFTGTFGATLKACESAYCWDDFHP